MSTQTPEYGQLVLAGGRGQELGNAFGRSCVEALQQVVGSKFLVDETGLRISSGIRPPSQEEVVTAINTLVRVSDQGDMLQSVVTFALGDLLVEAKHLFGADFMEIVEQLTMLTGKAKHTLMEALRISEAFAQEDRIPGLTKTHHQELLNYRGSVPPEDLERIMEEIFSEGAVVETLNRQGEVIRSETRPISSKKLREKLQAVSTSTRKPRAKEPQGYLYIDFEHQKVFRSQKLSDAAMADDSGFAVINLDNNFITNLYQTQVEILSESWFR